MQYLPEGKKIFADSHPGWICYVDEHTGHAYAKTFDLSEGAEYPDQDAHVEAWINSEPLLYLGVEVVSPIVELAPGGRYTFTEDWWAARVQGPVLQVNQADAIAQRLRLEGDFLSATCGVFYEGKARLVFIGGDGKVLGESQEHVVTPLETFILREKTKVPQGAVRAELRVSDPGGVPIGVLDAVELQGKPNLGEKLWPN